MLVQIQTFMNGMPDAALKLLNSLFVVAGGLIAIFIARKIAGAVFRTSKKKFPEKNYDTVSTILSSLIKYVGYFLIIFQVMSVFGVSTESVLAVAGVGSIAIGFGARGIAEDLITGASILFENQFRVGDTIEVNGKTGAVETIGLRVTTIRGYDGDVHIFPNSTIKIVTNMSKSFNRAVVLVPVSYEEPIGRILEILNDEMSRAGENDDALLSGPQVQGVVEMNNQYLVVRIIADCKVDENWAVERRIRRLVKTRFEAEQIAPPYRHPFIYTPERDGKSDEHEL